MLIYTGSCARSRGRLFSLSNEQAFCLTPPVAHLTQAIDKLEKCSRRYSTHTNLVSTRRNNGCS